MTNFLVHPCLHKIIVQPSRFFANLLLPLPLLKGWSIVELPSTSEAQRRLAETRVESQSGSQKEVLACLVPNAPLISRSIKRGAASSLGTNIT